MGNSRASLESRGTRIGLMGGTFDPVHLGHLRAAEEIREAFHLSRLEFIPARIPPHKTGRPFTSISHRIEMLRDAIRGVPGFSVSEAEAGRQGISYLVDTLRMYRSEQGPQASLFFIMGMDSFREIGTWHRYPEILSLSDFIVIARPGYERPSLADVIPEEVARTFREAQPDRSVLEHESGRKIYFQEITLLDISATRIREWARQGRSVRYLVPEGVLAYMRKHGLYPSARKD